MEFFVKDKYSILSYIYTCIDKYYNNICNDILNHLISVKFYIGTHNNIFHWCCKYGSLEHIKFLLSEKNLQIDELMPEFNIELNYDEAFYYACIYGKVDIAKYLIYLKEDIYIYNNYEKLFYICCGYNKLNSVKYLLSLSKNILKYININYILREVWDESCLDTIKYLMSIDKNNIIKNQIMNTQKMQFNDVCNWGHIDILKFLISINNNLIDRFDKDEQNNEHFVGRTPIYSCIGGRHLNMLKYMLSLNNNIQIDDNMLDRALSSFTNTGNENLSLQIVKYLLSLNNDLKCPNFWHSFAMACSMCNLEDIKYLISLNIIDINNNTIESCFRAICASGNINNAKYFYETYYVDNYNRNINLNIMFKDSCHYGNLGLMIYLLSIPNNNIDINQNDDIILVLACFEGYFCIVKFLLTLENNNININTQNNRPFKIACEKGYLNIIKYLLVLNNNIINKSTINCAFGAACSKGKFKVAKYLLSLKNNNIDIHSHYDFIFRQKGFANYKFVLRYMLENYLNRDKYHYYYYKNDFYYIVKPHAEYPEEITNKKLDDNITELYYPDFTNAIKIYHYIKRYEFFDVYYVVEDYIDDCIREYEIYYNRFLQKKGMR